ncbi:histidinol dehydrogenase [Limisalsivibrio acetivorans]|uniref:histidinol dehydrogenase n=1 Tax=Limisalsivibrio acetivorans TaxID=1304888 RepID=UPI0003B46B84|nr:histidinol dehydrogenase [Limisalsivibrio acetivorans]
MIIRRDDKKLEKILGRDESFDEQYLPAVMEIIENVRKNGDDELRRLSERFDGYSGKLEITPEEMEDAAKNLDPELKKALIKARDNITDFHSRQLEKTWMYEKSPGTFLGQKVTPLEKVGVYVPGGKAVYPSSVLMNVLPAKVAGVKDIVMTTPATGGSVNPVVLAAAHIAGVTRGFCTGGAQAVAALAYGTETIPRVDKIVGPGNIYVALAKKLVFGRVDIDMIAGPSEILIIADSSADPDKVAADMLSQAEHDELASSIAVTDDEALAKEIEKCVHTRLNELPKKDIARKSIENYGAVIVVDDMDEAAELSNSIAPEHLELFVSAPMELMLKIKHAGAIFLGENTPEPVGDYIAGPNHVLPTGGTARFFSPLGAYDFIKRSSILYYSREQLMEDMDAIVTLAEHEELIAHRNSATSRRK